MTEQLPPEVQEYFRIKGAKVQASLMQRFYREVDARWPDLDETLREEWAQELRRRHMAELGRRGGLARRTKTPG